LLRLNGRRRATHVVVDTDALSWAFDPRPTATAEEARALIGGRTRVASFVSVAELRYGALNAGWGQLRLRRLARSLADLDVVQTERTLIDRTADLRAWASGVGHPLGAKIHEADRWVAATALVLGLELVTGDRIFDDVAGLDVLRIGRA
jgi:predicted nucleic acid-binding protein